MILSQKAKDLQVGSRLNFTGFGYIFPRFHIDMKKRERGEKKDMVSTQDLKNKEVINIYNGKSIGFVDDITLNLEKGTVEGIVIPQSGGGLFSFFNRGSEIIVPWHCIRRIGDEVVLVEMRDGFGGDFVSDLEYGGGSEGAGGDCREDEK